MLLAITTVQRREAVARAVKAVAVTRTIVLFCFFC